MQYTIIYNARKKLEKSEKQIFLNTPRIISIK